MDYELREVRETDRDDIDALLSLMPGAYTEEGRRLFLRDVYAHHALVATFHKVACGIVSWASFTTEIEFLWLAIHPDHRRRGLATRLFQHVESRADESLRILLAKTADADNLPLHLGLSRQNYLDTMKFLKGYGFETVAYINDYFGPDNPAILMIKRIGRDND